MVSTHDGSISDNSTLQCTKVQPAIYDGLTSNDLVLQH